MRPLKPSPMDRHSGDNAQSRRCLCAIICPLEHDSIGHAAQVPLGEIERLVHLTRF